MINRILAAICRAFRRLCCKHNWTVKSDGRYNITGTDGEKVGEVSLLLFSCRECGKDWLIPHDKTEVPESSVAKKRK